MPKEIQVDFLEVAKRFGEKTDLWELEENVGGSDEKVDQDTENDSQLTLASPMTNTNCLDLETPNPTKCLECDFQVSRACFHFFGFEKNMYISGWISITI